MVKDIHDGDNFEEVEEPVYVPPVRQYPQQSLRGGASGASAPLQQHSSYKAPHEVGAMSKRGPTLKPWLTRKLAETTALRDPRYVPPFSLSSVEGLMGG